jgi:uncharacterized protein
MTQPSLPLDHSGLGVLSTQECFDRIARTPVGRIAFVSNGDPLILPVNYALDGDAVVFRSNAGSKLLAADAGSSVAFEVDGFEPTRRSGWSVVIRGVAETVEDEREIARLIDFGVEPWADRSDGEFWVRITTYGITGREILHPPEPALIEKRNPS